jgi:predicted transcriptional regulator
MRNRSYRDRIEIAADMLKKAKEVTKKTNIMYACNLSFSMNERYLQALLDSGLLALTPDGQYETTPQGRKAFGIVEEAIRTFSGFYERIRKK